MTMILLTDGESRSQEGMHLKGVHRPEALSVCLPVCLEVSGSASPQAQNQLS